MPELLSIKNAKQKLLSDLKEIGIERSEAERETQLIISEATGLTTAQQILEESRALHAHESNRISEIVSQRQKRIPLQYCLGYTYFMGLKLTIKKGVFIPRPDTETVVSLSQSMLSNKSSLKIAEIGIGSGAISIALLKQLPQARITAIDLSEDAIELSRDNAHQNGVIDRLTLLLGNWEKNLPTALDAIVSNPPYIPLSQRDSLEPEVVNHEPHLALFGNDADGLSFYRHFLVVAPAHLKDDGLVVLEFGDGQNSLVQKMFTNAGWRDVQIHSDLNGLPRVITATRPIKST